MTAAKLEIRRATAADAAALAAFAASVFRAAYAPDNDPADVELHVTRTYCADRQAGEIATPGCCYLLALEGTAIVGYAYLQLGATHPAVTATTPCEIRRFYVDPSRHGQGVATMLMTEAVVEARRSGAQTLWLSAWERNPRALRFYAKQGFADRGRTTFLLGSSAQTDRLLVRELS